jgi:hypothetical protein
MDQSYDFILAINFPKLKVSTHNLDNIITIDNDNLHILNLYQSTHPTNTNFSVLSYLNKLPYDPSQNKRYPNIQFNTDFFSHSHEGLKLYDIISSDVDLKDKLYKELDKNLENIHSYQELIDFLKEIGNSLGNKKMLLIDLVGYTLDAEAKELEDEQIERMFSAPGLRDVAFFSEKKKHEFKIGRKGGKRKTLRRSRGKSMRKSYKK